MPKRLPLTAESQNWRYEEFPLSITSERKNTESLRDPVPARRVDSQRVEFSVIHRRVNELLFFYWALLAFS